MKNLKLLQIRNRIERLKGERNKVLSSIELTRKNIRSLKQDERRHEQAREVVKQVGLKTQEQLQYNISDITTLALESVFDDPYELRAEFVERRNKTECDLYFVRDTEKVDPLSASGGGAVDVAAFALRIASFTMSRRKYRNVIILDEPLRFLSEDLQERASEMIKQLSGRLGIQFIIVTHNDTLTSYADRVFRITKSRGKSKVHAENR